MTHESDYYAILGIAPQATPEMIREAFAILLRNFPPETDPVNDPAYQQILHAYKVLSDPERRATYDSLLVETSPFALNVNIQTSREKINLSKTNQLVYLLIDIYTPDQNVESRLPLNLCLVIDRSTSMQGTRLDCVKSAVELIVEKLAPDDVLSVISFSDRAEAVVPAGYITNRHKITANVRSILASGGTEIYQGLNAGMSEMKQVLLRKHANHLILLTDGHTYGDADTCLQLAKEAATQGINLSAVGIGTEWNDQFLDKLVSSSGGQSTYIEVPTQIIEQLQEQIKGLGYTYARNVRFMPSFPESVSLQYGFKLTPFAQPLALEGEQIMLGNIEGHIPLSFLLELTIAPQSIETRINLHFNLTVDIPSQQLTDRVSNHQHQILILSDVSKTEPPPSLVKAVRMLNMYRMNEQVWSEVEAGQLEMAATRLRRLSTRLLEVGETKLAQQAYAETERLATMGTLSLEGRKKLKYGTRALLTLQLDQDIR